MSMGGGSSGGGSSTSTQKLDPWLKSQIEGNLNTIQNLPGYQQYPANQAIAPLTGQMQSSLGQMRQLGNQGVGLMNQGNQTLRQVANQDAQQIGLKRGMNPDEISVQGKVGNVSAGQANLDPFFNPYQSQVVDQTLNDLDRSRQMAITRGEDEAIGAGAFGGSRHGIADSETNRAYAQEAARTAGQLNQQGFNTALGAAQNQQGMNLQAGGMNQGAQQFNIGANLSAQQANQAMQQNMQGMDLSAQQANQAAGLDAGRLNLLAGQGLLGQGMGQFGMGQQAAQYGQDRNQATADFRFGQNQQAQMDPRLLAQMETAAIQGIPFMGSTSQSQAGGSRLGSSIGGAMSGAGMGGMLAGMSNGAFGGPMGMAVGGGLGLLGGMFG